jgi:hypothetical protein
MYSPPSPKAKDNFSSADSVEVELVKKVCKNKKKGIGATIPVAMPQEAQSP